MRKKTIYLGYLILALAGVLLSWYEYREHTKGAH